MSPPNVMSLIKVVGNSSQTLHYNNAWHFKLSKAACIMKIKIRMFNSTLIKRDHTTPAKIEKA
jgi:hypothetical protein